MARALSNENEMSSDSNMERTLYKVSKGLVGNHVKKRLVQCNGKQLVYWKSGEARLRGDTPVRRVDLGPSIRVEDTGVERLPSGLTLYTFAIHYTVRLWHQASLEAPVPKRLLLGAKEPEVAARWVKELTRIKDRSLTAATMQRKRRKRQIGMDQDEVASVDEAESKKSMDNEPVVGARSEKRSSNEETEVDAKPRAVMTPLATPREMGARSEERAEEEDSAVLMSEGSWRLANVMDGVRVFKGVQKESTAQLCLKGMSRVEAPTHVVFMLMMELGEMRHEWDVSFDNGEIVETVDGHTDVIRVGYQSYRLFGRRMMGKEYCIERTWREDEGSYMIFFKSVSHSSVPQKEDLKRRNLISGGYIISPIGKDMDSSLVTSTFELGSQGFLLDRIIPFLGLEWLMHARLFSSLAALRELVNQRGAEDMLAQLRPHASLDESIEAFQQRHRKSEREEEKGNNAVPQAAKQYKEARSSTEAEAITQKSTGQPKPMEVTNEQERAETSALSEGGSLPKVKSNRVDKHKKKNCWEQQADANMFRIRSAKYLEDKTKQPAGLPIGELVAVDWLIDDERIDDVCGRPEGIAQQRLLPFARSHDKFLFVVNFQVPANRHYAIVFYYLLPGRALREENSILRRVHNGDQALKDAHFKLIPRIDKGPWVVQRSVGTKPLVVGNALKVSYLCSDFHMECDVDISSSTVANSVVRFVMGYLRTLVIDIAFLFEGKCESDLPEFVLGTLHCSHLDPEQATRPPRRRRSGSPATEEKVRGDDIDSNDSHSGDARVDAIH